MTDAPAISVVMPVHNRAATVARAVQSVLDQQFRDFELIVVDDGSSDDSAKIVSAIDDPRIRLVRLATNRGGNAARNAGVAASVASLIAFLDSDDAYLPEKLQTVFDIFRARPDLDLLVDSFRKILPPGSIRRSVVRRNKSIDEPERFVRALFTRRLWKATPAITVRKDALIRAGVFDETLKRMQDFDLLARVAAVGRCASTDKVLWLKYWSRQSISGADDTWIPSNIELCRRHPEYLSNVRYRPGLAYALRLTIFRRLISGRLNSIRADIQRVAEAFGRRQTVALLFEACLPRPRP